MTKKKKISMSVLQQRPGKWLNEPRSAESQT